jgi:enoyl-CoA hydratase
VTHYIPSAHFHVVKDALADNHPIDRLLDGLHRDPGECELARYTPIINRAFSAPSVEEILARLDAESGEDAHWARETAGEIRKKSPTSLKIAFAQMQRGKALTLDEALKLEFRLASNLVATHDYREGIAARIAGKGRAPLWEPANLEAVDDDWVASLFATPVDGELELADLKPGL